MRSGGLNLVSCRVGSSKLEWGQGEPDRFEEVSRNVPYFFGRCFQTIIVHLLRREMLENNLGEVSARFTSHGWMPPLRTPGRAVILLSWPGHQVCPAVAQKHGTPAR